MINLNPIPNIRYWVRETTQQNIHQVFNIRGSSGAPKQPLHGACSTVREETRSTIHGPGSADRTRRETELCLPAYTVKLSHKRVRNL